MKKVLTLTCILTFIITIHSCKKDKDEATSTTDAMLFAELSTGGFSYFQGGAELNGVSPSPHGQFKLRFNSVANAALGSDGELPSGQTFPDGSLIVKELRSGGNTTLFVVMKKEATNVNASNGWLWAEFNTDGSSVYSVSNKGDACTGCHGSSINRDFTKTFDLH